VLPEFMPENRIIIDIATDGYILSTFKVVEACGLTPEQIVIEKQVIEEDRRMSPDQEELEACRNLFLEIMNRIGIFNSKHDRFHLSVKVVDRNNIGAADNNDT
jgi:hypothetical protein